LVAAFAYAASIIVDGIGQHGAHIERTYRAAVRWAEEHPDEYARGIVHGFAGFLYRTLLRRRLRQALRRNPSDNCKRREGRAVARLFDAEDVRETPETDKTD
jgi:hypothetical protein